MSALSERVAQHRPVAVPARKSMGMTLKTRRARNAVADAATYVLLTIGAFLSIVPLLWMVSTAFKPTAEIFGASFLPTKVTFEHFIELFRTNRFEVYLENSFLVCFFTVTLGTLLDAMGGFALAKGNFPGKATLFWVVLATMMVPLFVIIVPVFIVMSNLGLTNTLTGLVLPFLVTGFGIFVMTQNIKRVPDSLIEATEMDGCSLVGIFVNAILPVVRPALGALAILRFVNTWNAYLFPLVMVNQEAKLTIPLGISRLRHIGGAIVWGTTMAGSFLSVVPIMIFFLFMQRHFISGLTLGATKE